MSVSLDDIRRQVRQRSKMENSQFISGGDDNADNELDNLIDAEYAELYDLLAVNNYFTDAYEFSTAVGITNYDLPVNFYKSLGVEMFYQGNTLDLFQFNWRERNRYKNATQYFQLGPPSAYRLVDGSLMLLPTPSGVYPITLWFIPQRTKLVLSSDTIKNTIIESWIEYVLCGVTAMLLAEEESDNTYWLSKKQEVKARIVVNSESREWANPEKIAQVRQDFWWY